MPRPFADGRAGRPLLPMDYTDQLSEVVEYLHHLTGAVDALGILVCVLLGVVVALLLTSRK